MFNFTRPKGITEVPYILVNSMDDLPPAVWGVITIPSWYYIIDTVIITSDRFEFEPWAIVYFNWLDAFKNWIIYTWTGNFLTWTDFSSISTKELFLSCPNWTLVDVQPVSQTLWALFLITTAIFDCAALWTVKNIDNVSIDFSAFQDIWTWLIIDNVRLFAWLSSQVNWWKNVWTTMLTIQWTVEEFLLNWITIDIQPTDTLFDFKAAWNIKWDVIWVNADFDWVGWKIFAAWSKDQKDVNLKFSAWRNIPDSKFIWSMNFEANSSTTIISWVNVWTKVNWVTLAGANIERFEMTDDNQLTYTWLEEIWLTANVSLSCIWQNTDYEFTLFKNWSKVSNVTMSVNALSTKPSNISFIAPVTAVTNDFFEVYVRNILNTWNMSVVDMQVSIN